MRIHVTGKKMLGSQCNNKEQVLMDYSTQNLNCSNLRLQDVLKLGWDPDGKSITIELAPRLSIDNCRQNRRWWWCFSSRRNGNVVTLKGQREDRAQWRGSKNQKSSWENSIGSERQNGISGNWVLRGLLMVGREGKQESGHGHEREGMGGRLMAGNLGNR